MRHPSRSASESKGRSAPCAAMASAIGRAMASPTTVIPVIFSASTRRSTSIGSKLRVRTRGAPMRKAVSSE